MPEEEQNPRCRLTKAVRNDEQGWSLAGISNSQFPGQPGCRPESGAVHEPGKQPGG